MGGNFISTPARGLRDWLIQRLSALYMTAYVIFLFVCIFAVPATYVSWVHLIANGWVLIATILFLAAILWHAWVGVWTVITDYVKCPYFRATLKLAVCIVLVACFIWGLGILMHIHTIGS